MSETRTFVPLDEAQPPFFVGVDVGGTNVKVGVVDDEGGPLSWLSIKTESQRGPEDATIRMSQAIAEAVRLAGLDRKQIAHIGLGTPGTQDISAGKLLEPPNLKGWEDFPIVARLEHHCQSPIVYANDAGAAAYGEYWVGSGRQYQSMVLFTLGTGVGAGIIIDDRSIDGAHSHGAECGHIIIDCRPDARICGCGQAGHLEAYASATGLVKRAHDALAGRNDSTLSQRLGRGEELTPLMIGQEAAAGDVIALELVIETARYVGIGAVSLMHTIDPEAVIIGGAMTFGGHATPLGRQFLDVIRTEVRRRALPLPGARTVIDFAQLGGDAGYIGAAGLARAAYWKTHSG